MWHRLALRLGGTIEELQERMSSAEFTYWCAYYNLEPWGYEIGNFRSGIVAATMVNMTPRKKGAKAMLPSDFYPASQAGKLAPSTRYEKQLQEYRKKVSKKKKKMKRR